MPALEPKYPHIIVQITGKDGNAFSILGNVGAAMRKNNILQEEREMFYNEATSGDYNHLLQTCTKWVTCK